MDRVACLVVAACLIPLAACSGSNAPSSSRYTDENAALRRITLDEFTDVSIEIDDSTIGGFDLEEAAPRADIGFCGAASSAPIGWVDGSAIPVQYWHDAFAAADDVPASVRSDVALLLEHTAQRVAWNLRRAEEPVLGGIVEAAHRVVTEAVESCPEFPSVVGATDEQLRTPWPDGSYNDLDPVDACASDLAEVTVAVDRYVELRSAMPRHLEQVRAALLADESVFFFGSDLHALTERADGSVAVEPIPVGPCSA